MDLKVVKDSFFSFDRTQLLDTEESLLCDCPMVVDYMLEINIKKRQNI